MRSATATLAVVATMAGLWVLGATSGAAAAERHLFAEIVDRNSGRPPSDTPQVRLFEEGSPFEVLSIAPIDPAATPWEVVLYFDLVLSGPELIAQASDLFADHVDELVALGDVTVVAATTGAETLELRSRDPEAVRFALADLGRMAGQAGELAIARANLEALLASDDGDPRRAVLQHRFREDEVREWQDQLLVDWLYGPLLEGRADDLDGPDERADEGADERATIGVPPLPTSPRPRVLYLVRRLPENQAAAYSRELFDRFDLKLDAFSEKRLEDADDHRERDMARLLAATGWTVFPVVLGDRGRNADKSDPSQIDRELAESTGGALLSDVPATSTSIEALAGRWHLRLGGGSATASEEPVPLDLDAGPQLQVRASRWSAPVPPRGLARVRGRQVLRDDYTGSLPVRSVLLGETAGASILETELLLGGADGGPGSTEHLRLSVLTFRLDRDPIIETFRGSGLELLGQSWVTRTPVRVYDDLEGVVVVAEDLRTGVWGAAVAEEAEESLVAQLASSQATVETLGDVAPSRPGRPTLAERGSGGRFSRRSERPADTASPTPGSPTNSSPTRSTGTPSFKIVPPRERPIYGKKRFNVLLSSETVRQIEFFLDGTSIKLDDNRPFGVEIDLGDTVEEHELRAVAKTSNGAFVGEDIYKINPPRSQMGVHFTEIAEQGNGDVDTEAEVLLEENQVLDRIEFYRNERLVLTRIRPPYAATLPGPSRPDADFVRVVAWLDDGSFLEDVQLLGSDANIEEVEVNLVQVYTVVTDENGEPVKGLEAGDFEMSRGGKTIAIERFGLADEIPLSIGLVIDSSSSMAELMDATRSAAARFMSRTMNDGDRAFVVSFDDRPRLVRDETSDILALIESLGRLRAGGVTALYDSILYALLHFDTGLGRKAVVLLTDGDDFNSKTSYRNVYKNAAEGGIPVYFVALGGFIDGRPTFRKFDLEAIANNSGGRVFYVSGLDEVMTAYDRISEELRAQYVLAFTTDRALTDDEVGKIKVKLDKKRKGWDLRSVVGRDR